MMSGSENCLKMLADRGVQLYVASASDTDDADVKQEV
jgi:hypothetical protein